MGQIDLCSQTEVRRLLDKYGLAPKKGYGQNFLINTNVPYRIAEESYAIACAKGGPCHGVLEIGPGVGALTQYLCDTYDKVVAVEIDTGLIPLLAEALGDCGNLTVVNTDFMELDLTAFLEEHFGEILAQGGNVSVCANLPYYITTPVLMKLLEAFPFHKPVPLAGITVMVQLEVARRLCAPASPRTTVPFRRRLLSVRMRKSSSTWRPATSFPFRRWRPRYAALSLTAESVRFMRAVPKTMWNAKSLPVIRQSLSAWRSVSGEKH